MNYDSAYIKRYAEFARHETKCSFRNEILTRVIRLAEGVSNEKPKGSNT